MREMKNAPSAKSATKISAPPHRERASPTLLAAFLMAEIRSESRIEGIAEPLSEEVEPKDGRTDEKRGKEGERRLPLHQALAFAEHRAPTRRRRREPK